MADTVSTGGSLSLAVTFMLKKETIPVVRTRLVYAQFGQDGKLLPGTDMIRFLKKPDIAADTTYLADEVTNPTPEALPAITKVDISTKEIGRVVSISRRAGNISPLELVGWAKDTLAFDAARRIDHEVKEVIKAGGTVMYSGAASSRVTVDTVLKATDIRRSLIKLQALDLDTSGVVTAVTHPFVVGDLMGETTNPGGWQAVHQYSGQPEAIYNGEVGRLYNTRFMTTTNAIKFTAAGAASADVYTTFVALGPWAFGKANIEDLRFTAVPPTPDHADALGRRWLLGYYMDFGCGVLDSTKFIRFESTATSV